MNELILENFSLSPYDDFIGYMPEAAQRGNQEIYQMIAEVTEEPTPKKNIFQKIFGLVKKMFAFIGRMLTNLFNTIKSLFSSKHIKQTAEGIAEKLGLKPTQQEEDVIEYDTIMINTDNDAEDHFKFKQMSQAVQTKFNGQTIEFCVKHGLFWKRKTGNLDMNTIYQGMKTHYNTKHLQVAGNDDFAYSDVASYITLNFISDDSFYQPLLTLITCITDNINVINDITKSGLNQSGRSKLEYVVNQINYVWDLMDSIRIDPKRVFRLTTKNVELGMKLANTFNRCIMALNVESPDAMGIFDHVIINGKQLAFHLNRLASMGKLLQYGLNYITASMANVYVIPTEYANSITDPNQMAAFTQELIKAGIPTKYVAFNIFAAATKDLRGDAKLSQPRMGQGRLTLIPRKNDKVYKFALNGFGQRANKSECELSDKLVKVNDWVIITPVRKMYDNYCGIEMDYADTNRKISKRDFNDLKGRYLEALKSAGLDRIGLMDFTPSNAGYYQGVPVLIDYGSQWFNPTGTNYRRDGQEMNAFRMIGR